MKMTLKKFVIGILVLVCSNTFTSCTYDIPEENRFTFTGQLISTYLETDSNKTFSRFCEILKKARIGKMTSGNMLKTLSTYGSYTCFAPTNAALDSFFVEQYRIYAEDPEKDYGITAPEFELLSDKNLSEEEKDRIVATYLDNNVATEMAKNHIIERACATIDLTGNSGTFPEFSINRREIPWEINSNGKYVVERKAQIIKHDIETENGYVQVVDGVINPSSKKLDELIDTYKELSIFRDAVYATGFDSLLNIYEIDPNYDGTLIDKGLPSGAEGEAPYPESKHQCYTLLAEPNTILNEAGINNVDDLEEFARKFYGSNAMNNRKDTANALYKFVAYHILDRKLIYGTNIAGAFIMKDYKNTQYFDSEINLTDDDHDRYDYFETMLPYTLIKVTMPRTNEKWKNEIVLNYAQEKGEFITPDGEGLGLKNHINVIVVDPTKAGIEDFDPKALNGNIYTINKILVYNENEMIGNILKERMRWDISSFFPEWTNNGVRWAKNTPYKIHYIPEGFCKRLKINSSDSKIFYLHAYQTHIDSYANYMGDEMLATGLYDFEYRLPYVPAGTYEIRFGYSISPQRAVTQFYLDGKICGIPVDMLLDSEDPLIGWESDKDSEGNLKPESDIQAIDKSMRNRGYMKGPASCILDDKGSMRDSKKALRRIVKTEYLSRGDHWMRFKNVTESTAKEFNQDFLELVPVSIIKENKEDKY